MAGNVFAEVFEYKTSLFNQLLISSCEHSLSSYPNSMKFEVALKQRFSNCPMVFILAIFSSDLYSLQSLTFNQSFEINTPDVSRLFFKVVFV